MKLFICALLATCCCLFASAQKPVASIELKVKDIDEGIITVTLPVNHTVFWADSRTDTIKKNKLHVIGLSEKQTGYVSIDVLGRPVRLFVQKGNTIQVTIDEENTEKPVLIEGDNHAGQALLTSAELPYAGNMIVRYKNDTTAALLLNHVEQDKKIRQQVYTLLYEQRKIDKPFYDFILLTLDYYHASLISEVIYSKYNLTQLPKEHPQYKPVFPADFAVLWEKTYKQYPVNNPAAMQSPGYNDGFNTYAGNYISGYVGWLKNKYGTASVAVNWSAEMKETLQRIQNNLEEPVAEYIKAGILYTELSLEKNYGELIKMASDFTKKYPGSAYTPYIEPLLVKANAYYSKVRGEFTSEQKIIPDYARINSFGELMSLFKGKPVFIEFWATWCITCKDQFDHEKELHRLLQSKNAAHLFISLDHQVETEEWKELIKYYNLRGSHIRANPSLIKDLTRIFWNGKAYALPLYVLIGASGNIVEEDAFRPGDKKRLYQQINRHFE
ncbi:MAG: TlpA family protein disulfide reductase [Chitinophagaceae bacterium]|nr:TlpA family protein disulfide reductase [Chitinophagaceae bacterium]